ncbi:MAG TPA: hypothetical protein VGO93_07655 [Candidatus Xenobia bacterium]|jgi:hypothetical protein
MVRGMSGLQARRSLSFSPTYSAVCPTCSAVPPRAEVDDPVDLAVVSKACPGSRPRANRLAALAALALILPGVATLASTAMAQVPQTVQVQDDSTARLADAFGVTPAVIQKVEANPANAALPTIPDNLQQAWKAVPRQDRLDFDKGFQGSTWGFSNKKAFINGHVMGHDVFADAQKDLIKELHKTQDGITLAQLDHFSAIFKAASGCSKEQRQAFMALMDADAGR